MLLNIDYLEQEIDTFTQKLEQTNDEYEKKFMEMQVNFCKFTSLSRKLCEFFRFQTKFILFRKVIPRILNL